MRSVTMLMRFTSYAIDLYVFHSNYDQEMRQSSDFIDIYFGYKVKFDRVQI